MDDAQLLIQVRALRAEGRSPKAIARGLGLRPAHASALVRAVARDQAEAASGGEPGLVGCWISPGYSVGLGLPDDRGWPDELGHGSDAVGIVAVVVAREAATRDRVSVCGYLVDTYCLGVKDALGPREMGRGGLRRFIDRFFDAFYGEPLSVPADLARHLVWGAVAYAGDLGFSPHPDFTPAAGHLGALDGPSEIRFGRNGKPFFMQGPFDDPGRVLRTLRARVGDDFEFCVVADAEELAPALG
jgi:hypothetical protein